MDWQTTKVILKAFASLAVIFYLIVVFVFRIFAEDKDEDI